MKKKLRNLTFQELRDLCQKQDTDTCRKCPLYDIDYMNFSTLSDEELDKEIDL